jgi:hypothetical protein
VNKVWSSSYRVLEVLINNLRIKSIGVVMDNLASHYNINVAKRYNTGLGIESKHRYSHYFCTKITSAIQAREVFADLKVKYPEPEFNVDVTYWDIGGTIMDWS